MTRKKQIDVTDRAKISRLKSKKYRDAYLEAQVHSWISHQFRALRTSMGFTQKEMAEKIGKPQSVVSRLENDEYGKVSVQTLLDVAHAVDVALLVQFVSYPDFLARMRDKSADGMVPETISESVVRVDREIATEASLHMLNRGSSVARSGNSLGQKAKSIFSAASEKNYNNFNRLGYTLVQNQKRGIQTKERVLQ